MFGMRAQADIEKQRFCTLFIVPQEYFVNVGPLAVAIGNYL
jgi:hypothetical protein